MEKTTLGHCGVAVSRLCFGSLTVGPLQANLPVEEGAAVIAYAFERGISFLDTAQYYQNYSYIRRAMQLARRYDVVISTKTYAYTRAGAEEALEEARRMLDRDYIDLFLLHEQESIHTLRGHIEALDYLLDMKARGVIRAVGASMHHIAAVDGVMALNRQLDVIHPIYNMRSLGIADGDAAGMLASMQRAHAQGIGIFSMKPLGGGNLHSEAEAALRFVLDCGAVDAVAIGMQSAEEVDANIEFFEKGRFSAASRERLDAKTRSLHIEDYCEGCGKCVARCGQGALTLAGGRAVCDPSKCVLCGYCSAACSLFAIKVV